MKFQSVITYSNRKIRISHCVRLVSNRKSFNFQHDNQMIDNKFDNKFNVNRISNRFISNINF